MTKVKVTKVSLEEEVKTLQKHMGAIIATVKDLKNSVAALQKKESPKLDAEIKDIIETQKVVDGVIGANSEAIRRIEREIKIIENSRSEHELVNDATGKLDNDTISKESKKTKRCRYYNRGYCKYKDKCRFIHPKSICQEYLRVEKCENQNCSQRHPKRCKWEESKGGCKRNLACDYFHVTSAHEMENCSVENSESEYQCVGCKDVWNNKNCVVEHVVRKTKVVFCLNCDDWIKVKEAVFDQGWTLQDEAGYLRQNI